MVAFEAPPQSRDPRFGVDATSARLFDLLHTSLTRSDRAGRRTPELAARWEQADATTLVFHLRTDFRFPDGRVVDSHDVRATYEALLDPAIASPRRAALAVLSGVEAPDVRTVVFHLREPFSAGLDLSGIPILPAAEAAAPAEQTTGAGPFRLVPPSTPDRMFLEPNPNWPGPPPPISRLEIRVVPDEVVRILELERGNIHLVQEAFEPEVREYLARRPDLEVREIPGSSFVYLALNCRTPWLGERRARQALSFALAREGLIRYALGGAARPASGLLSPEHWAFVRLPTPPHRPAHARRLLDRAGFPDPPGPAPRFRIVLKTSTQLGRRRLAEALQGALADVGVALDLRTYEWGTLYGDVRSGNFEATTLAWVGVADPDLYYLAFHSAMTPPAGYNRGYYRDPVLDRLLTAGRTTVDAAGRRRVYARIQRRLARTLPVIPLWWEDRVVVQSRRLRDFEPEPSGDLRGLSRARFE